MQRPGRTLLVALAVIVAGILLAKLRVNPYFYFAGYVILQYIVIATAWNILGGYAGYVNFGTPAFFALGAYTAVFLIRSVQAPLPVLHRGRRTRRRAARARDRLSHPALARHLLLDRDPGPVRRAADRDHRTGSTWAARGG